MTTCQCRETEQDALVMTRDYLQDLTDAKARVARRQAIDEVIELIEAHQNAWASQSANIGSGTFYNTKARTAQTLITEIKRINK